MDTNKESPARLEPAVHMGRRTERWPTPQWLVSTSYSLLCPGVCNVSRPLGNHPRLQLQVFGLCCTLTRDPQGSSPSDCWHQGPGWHRAPGLWKETGERGCGGPQGFQEGSLLGRDIMGWGLGEEGKGGRVYFNTSRRTDWDHWSKPFGNPMFKKGR
jgi:hypothetical protein